MPFNHLYILLEKFPDKPWSRIGLSRNPNITFDIVLSQPDKPWDWYGLSSNIYITIDNVLKHPDKPWDWDGLSQNRNITFDIVSTYPDKPWNWRYISYNPNITFDIVLSHPDKPWNWYGLSYNKFNRQNSAIVIQRYYKRYLKRKHNSIYKYVMNELRMNPHPNALGFRGIDFEELKCKVEKILN